VIDQFLAQDPQFAALLKQGDELRRVVPAVRLTPDAELRLLLDARKTARLKLLIIGGSIVPAGRARVRRCRWGLSRAWTTW
jgi:hypothetical protein